MASNDMTMRFGVDDGDFRAGISRMKSSVQGLTNEWKENEKAYKQLGDTQSAQKAKVEGLTMVLKRQKDMMDGLKQAEKDLGARTKDNAGAHNLLQKEMGKLGADISKTNAALNGQKRVLDQTTKATDAQRIADQRLAKEQKEIASTYKHRDAELKQLNSSLKTNDAITKGSVESLKRNKNVQQAMSAEYQGLTNSIKKQDAVRKIEIERLGRIRNMTDATSDSINRQKLKVVEATNSLGKYQERMKLLQIQQAKSNPFGNSQMMSGMNQAWRASEKMNSAMTRSFHAVRSGAISASIGIGIMGTAAVKGAEKAGQLEKVYIENKNLMITSGEKTAEVIHHVAKMQQDGRDMAIKYGKSQQEAADGYQELIKRGYTGAQAIGSMESIMQASIASGDSLVETLHSATGALEGFAMQSKDTDQMAKNTHEVVNKLAYAADTTATDFHMMGKSMEYVSSTAHTAGISLSETSAAIGILSNNNIAADKAGTGLQATITRLQNPTKAARDALNDLGLSVADFTTKGGKMKPIADILELINDRAKGLTDMEQGALNKALFGQIGMRSAQVLRENAAGLRELTGEVDNAAKKDYVRDLADRNMEAVTNQLNQFKAVMEEMQIAIGKQMLPVLNEFSKKMVAAFTSPEGQKGLENLAKGIAKAADTLVGVIVFMGEHTGAVKAFAKVFASIWAVNKIGKVLGLMRQMKATMLEMAAINAFSGSMGGAGLFGGGKGKGGKGPKMNPTQVAGNSGYVGPMMMDGATKGGKPSKLGKFAGGAKAAGRLAAPLALLMSAGELFHGSTGERIGGFAGSLGGAAGGAAAGAALGSVVPVAGTAVGAVAGAVLGGVGGAVGGDLGRKAGGSAEKAISKESKAKDEELKKTKKRNKETAESYKNMSNDIRVSNEQLENSTNKNPVNIAKAIAKVNKEMRQYDTEYKKRAKELNKALSITVTTDASKNKAASQQIQNALKAMDQNETKHAENKKKRQKENFEFLTKEVKMSGKQKDAYKKSLGERQKADEENTKFRRGIIKKMSKEEGEYQERLIKIQEGGSKEAKKIAEKYGKSDARYKRQIQKDLEKEQDKHNGKMVELEQQLGEEVSKETQIAAGKQQDILKDLKEGRKKLSMEEIKETVSASAKLKNTQVKDAEETYKKSVDAANKKFDEVTAKADEEYYVNKTISKKQYDEIIGTATKEKDDVVKKATEKRDESVKRAEETHNGVVDQAQKQAKEHGETINRETGEALGTWDKFVGGMAGLVNGFSGIVNGVLGFFNGPQIPMWKPKGYATGTKGLLADETALVGEEGFELAYHPQKGIHVLGKNGPEITDLKAGTSILPHDMSKQFLAMAQTIPAHKDGVMGTISDMYNGAKSFVGNVGSSIGGAISGGVDWVVDKAKDVWDFIDKGAKSVVTSAWNSAGGNSLTPPAGGGKTFFDGGSQHILDSSIKALQEMFDKKEAEEKAKAPSGAGVQRWAGLISKALAANGLATNPEMVNKVLRQIATESGGDERAVQGDIGDINNKTGDLAKGLMQTISSTFNAFAHPGHGNIFNGYDNLLAALNYAKSRYGSDLSYLGQGHGYEHGGIITEHQIAQLGEKGKREAVIPLDISERSNAIPLLQTAVNEIAGQTQHNKPSGVEVTQPQETDLGEVLDKMNGILAGLEQVVLAVNTALTPQRVTHAVNTQTQLNSNLQAQMRGI